MKERELKNWKKEMQRREKRCEKCEKNKDWYCTVSNWPARLMIICQKQDEQS